MTSRCCGPPSSVSTAGSSLTDLAAGIYVYRVTESALAVGLTLMATAIPSLIVGLLAGVYVDRHDRQRVMIVTCLIQAVLVGLIAVVLGIEAIALPGLYLLILLNAGVKQFFDPAHDSLLPELASDEELLRGQRVPVDRLVRVDRDRLCRRRPAGEHDRADLGVHHRRGHVPDRRRLHRPDAQDRDARPRRRTPASRSSWPT